ncbi:MAG TPA: hypothetical protein VG650_18780 [Mycobacteriales bacterium]|nr:hypothetical protein [Mycobacteriales bacterium]
MELAYAVLAAAVLFGLVGFEIHLFWIVADMLLVAWSLGFIARARQGARWYRW